jgi:SAM-dependent methyltransferase
MRHIHKLDGILLDIGCGEMPYRNLIMSHGKVKKYIGLDLEFGSVHDTSVADLHWNGISIPLNDTSVDCIVATEFLEHINNADAIAKEMYRVLKPGGVILFTVPFIWPLHEVPHDEYRYTPFSLKRIFDGANFQKANLQALGGWNSSLAVMLGLWACCRPESRIGKIISRIICKPIIQFLLKKDKIPNIYDDNTMMPGIGGIIIK